MFTGGMLITSGAYCYRKMNDKEKGRIKKRRERKELGRRGERILDIASE